MNQPWRIDADRINIGEIDTSKLSDYLVITPDIEEFLKIGRDDNKHFLVAPKGLGKTLLLKVKSQMYRSESSGYSFLPEEELVEKLTKLNVSLSTKDIEKFKTVEIWEKVWWIALTSVILIRFEKTLPAELAKILGDAESLNDVLAALLNERAGIDKLYEYIATDLRPSLRKLRKKNSVSQIAFFIDNVDECLEMHTGANLEKYQSGLLSQPLSEEVWKNAQLALLLVVKQICQTNKHIKIFASCRSEAFVTNKSPLALQLEDLAIILEYSKAQICEIFEQNINLMSASMLTCPNDELPIQRLFGFTEIPHKFALDGNDEKRKELVFDYLYRHTFGRPREIVDIGKAIARLDKDDRDVIKVCRIVNDRSHMLLEQYKKEIIPFFPKEIFREFCEQAESNVITYKNAKRISALIEQIYKFEHAFSYFWRLGLVGTVEQSSVIDPTLRQIFQVAGTYNNDPERRIPESSDYFVLHSSMDKELRSNHGVYFYNYDNIIGHNYLFYKPRSKVRNLQHTHVGLERDDFSIVLPELNRTRSIAIILIPNPSWHELRNARSLTIQTNNNDEVVFSVINDEMSSSDIEAQIERWQSQNHNILLYSNNHSLISRLLRWSITISSTHLGSSLREVLTLLNRADSKHYLYFFQRFPNPTIENQIKSLLEHGLKSNLISLVPSIVDRLTFDRNISINNGEIVYDVTTESYGRLIMRWREGATMDSNSIVRRIRTDLDESWYRAKYLFLNEAIYRLYKAIKKSEATEIERVKLHEMFEIFFHIQIARLWDKYDPKNTDPHSGQQEGDIYDELLNYAENNLERFEKLDKTYQNIVDTNLVLVSKNNGMFPSDIDFYRFSAKVRDFAIVDVNLILALRKHLQVDFSTDYSSVFISYNTKDSEFASKINRSMQKRGIKTFLFEKDKPSKNIETIMIDEINLHDKVLFIASKNSIQSDSCQFELTQGRLKAEKNWTSQIYVTVSLDNYIFDIKKQDIKNSEKQDEYWKNIEHLKKSTIYRFDEHRYGKLTIEFEQEFDKLLPSFFREE